MYSYTYIYITNVILLLYVFYLYILIYSTYYSKLFYNIIYYILIIFTVILIAFIVSETAESIKINLLAIYLLFQTDTLNDELLQPSYRNNELLIIHSSALEAKVILV